MATALHASPVPTPSTSAPPTPPYPTFPRLPSTGPSISRNASTSSSRSTTTVSSTTSSLVAAPIRPPPIETRTAATTPAQLPSRPTSTDPTCSNSRNNSGGTSAQQYAGQVGYSSPAGGGGGMFGGRGFMRNGPRSRTSTLPTTPSIITSTSPSPAPAGSGFASGSDTRGTPERSHTAPVSEMSPTTPRAQRWPSPEMVHEGRSMPLRVTVSMDPVKDSSSTMFTSPLAHPRPVRGREGQWSTPSSPIEHRSPRKSQRTLSVDGVRDGDGRDRERERGQSQASASSSNSAGGLKRPSIRDFVLGEELGRGSYSTVVQATSVAALSPSSPRSIRQYAIKIINQAHLIAEKKAKYAVIERDALIRLAVPSPAVASTPSKGHRRGMSSSSSAGATRRKSNASISGSTGIINRKDVQSLSMGNNNRLSVASDSSPYTVHTSAAIPKSPNVAKSSLAGRRPSRSAEPPEIVLERSEENVLDSPVDALRSRPPSPVKEESFAEGTPSVQPAETTSSTITTAPPTPDPSVVGSERKLARKRRESLASSEISTKSNRFGVAHPGIIRLHSTFNDQTSLYFVLDLAQNGEILAFIRNFGSLDLVSARYYAAQLIDTIEFMHDRGVIHRDLKPENILLDEDMRTKITDFGSAKILGKDVDLLAGERKRSFVGSADFVSPEVLRNESAVLASDIWAFGCILYHLLVGKPPFRGATDYLTFQKILKRDMEFPQGFDEEAKSLIDLVFNLEPSARPTPGDIKSHAFFSLLDFTTLWQIIAPPMSTGLTPPVAASANASDSDIWAVFDDEVSDGGFDLDDAEDGGLAGHLHPIERLHTRSPQFDRFAAANAVKSVDHEQSQQPHVRNGSSGSLEPPRPAFVDGQRRKNRGWSAGSRSARTSSSSSGNRTALTGLLETMGIHTLGPAASSPSTATGSNRTSRNSDRVEEIKALQFSPTSAGDGEARWSTVLLANEKITLSTPISVRPSPNTASLIPSFLSPVKRRQLILTDLPRLVEIKDEEGIGPSPRIKFEAVFTRQSTELASTPESGQGQAHAGDLNSDGQGGSNRVVEVLEKGPKGFIVNTSGGNVLYIADTMDVRTHWIHALKRVMG